MAFDLKNQPLSFDCPKCGKQIEFTVNQIGTSISCPHCNQKISLEDNGVTDAVDNVEKQLNDFTDSLKNLF